jgi:hypothetical protein
MHQTIEVHKWGCHGVSVSCDLWYIDCGSSFDKISAISGRNFLANRKQGQGSQLHKHGIVAFFAC